MQLDAHFAIGNFIADRLHGGPIHVRGRLAVRSYLYASDLMVWLWTILFKGQSCRAYNVGSEDALNIAALAREVAAALPPKVDVDDRRPRQRPAPRFTATCPARHERARNWDFVPKYRCAKPSAALTPGFRRISNRREAIGTSRIARGAHA